MIFKDFTFSIERIFFQKLLAKNMNYLFLPGFGRIPIDIMDILRRI
jgi:hypothetical protein